MKYCVNCGQQLPDHALFCSNCGAKQPVQEQAPAQEQSVAKAEVVYEEYQTEEPKKNKTDLSAYTKVKTFVLWGVMPLVFLLINVIFQFVGILQIFAVIPHILLSVFGIVLGVINFVKRLKNGGFNSEAGIAISLAVLDHVSLICAFIFVINL